MEYNKFGNKQGRRVSTRGPRDLQRRQRQMEQASVFSSNSIDDLTKEITDLKKQIGEQSKEQNKISPGQMFTAEQVDERINKAVIESVEEVKIYYNQQMKELRDAIKPTDEVKLLEHTLKLRDAEIMKLGDRNVELEAVNNSMGSDMGGLKEMLTETTKKMETLMNLTHEGVEYHDSDRPQMEEVFIDPIEKEEKLKAFIDVKDVDESTKVSMDEKVDKLKSLFGGKIPQ